jgi:hypothetical protein
MSGDSQLSVVLLAGSLVSLLILVELVGHRINAMPRETPSSGRNHSALSPFLPALVCAFLCLMGLLLILPWAASLSSQTETRLETGIVFAILLAAGILHVSTRTPSPW